MIEAIENGDKKIFILGIVEILFLSRFYGNFHIKLTQQVDINNLYVFFILCLIIQLYKCNNLSTPSS